MPESAQLGTPENPSAPSSEVSRPLATPEASATPSEVTQPPIEQVDQAAEKRIREITASLQTTQVEENAAPNIAETLEERAAKLNQHAASLQAEHEPADKGPGVSQITSALLEAEEQRARHLSALSAPKIEAAVPILPKTQPVQAEVDPPIAAVPQPTNLMNLEQERARRLEAQFENNSLPKAA